MTDTTHEKCAEAFQELVEVIRVKNPELTAFEAERIALVYCPNTPIR